MNEQYCLLEGREVVDCPELSMDNENANWEPWKATCGKVVLLNTVCKFVLQTTFEGIRNKEGKCFKTELMGTSGNFIYHYREFWSGDLGVAETKHKAMFAHLCEDCK